MWRLVCKNWLSIGQRSQTLFSYAHPRQQKGCGPLTVSEWYNSLTRTGWVLVGDNLLLGQWPLCYYKKLVIIIDNVLNWVKD